MRTARSICKLSAGSVEVALIHVALASIRTRGERDIAMAACERSLIFTHESLLAYEDLISVHFLSHEMLWRLAYLLLFTHAACATAEEGTGHEDPVRHSKF